MTGSLTRLPVILALLAMGVAGCATTPRADVLRFHQSAPIAAGGVFIRPADPTLGGSLEFRAQANAVAEQLQAHGFTPTSSPQTAVYTATVRIDVAERMAAARQSGLSIGIGGGFSNRNVGLGTGISVPVGEKSTARTNATTTLSVVLASNPGNQSVWEGRASLDTETRGLHGSALAPILARTLFADFPGESGKTLSVPIR